MNAGPSGTGIEQPRVPNRWGEGRRLRQEILDAALRVLEETGRPEELSLRAIARAAGVTAPAVYRHFTDKSELMWTLLDAVYTALAETMRAAQRSAPADDPWSGLRAAIDAYSRFATDEPRRYDLMFRVGPTLPPPTPTIDYPMSRVLTAWCEAIAPYLADHPHGAMSVEQTAKLVWSSLHGHLGLWWNLPPEDRARELDGLRDCMLFALFGRT